MRTAISHTPVRRECLGKSSPQFTRSLVTVENEVARIGGLRKLPHSPLFGRMRDLFGILLQGLNSPISYPKMYIPSSCFFFLHRIYLPCVRIMRL